MSIRTISGSLDYRVCLIVRLAILVLYQLMTGRQTDRRTDRSQLSSAYAALAQRRAVKWQLTYLFNCNDAIFTIRFLCWEVCLLLVTTTTTTTSCFKILLVCM